ncbi:MAG: NPCBM/NEW2 domain-containing protein [Bacteroidales bacterium]|nr:NPCBM/NEW2 domain-containing protein [Bacteroidales bacterium]
MKRLLTTTLITLLAVFTAGAQDYLVKKFQPVESLRYHPHYAGVRGENDDMYIATFRCSNGFNLYKGVTYDDGKEGAYAVFSLKGQYEKITFIMGPGRSNDDRFAAGDQGKDIIIVTADGKRLVDDVLHQWDAPKIVTLDISGVDMLRFEDWSGLEGVYFGEIKLWKKGQTPTPYNISNSGLMAKDKVKLMEELRPHLICHRGWSKPITQDDYNGISEEEYISINRQKYYSGISMSASQELGEGISAGFVYFWLQKKFDKLSFLVGPRDNMSSNAKAWLTVKGDGKIIFEKLISQQDLAEICVVDVSGVNVVSFHCGELETSDFLKGMTFGVVDIYAYKKGSKDIPTPGIANIAKEKLSNLPDAVKLCSSHEPYSVRGMAGFDQTYFKGTSSHYHFSMGGEQFDEGFILTTGSTFMDGNINSYVAFDIAGEFDWVSFTVGTLSKHKVLGEDRLLVFADDNLILDTYVHCLWPNQKFTLPIGKCRILKFAKPGNGENKQTFIGVGDVMLFRGEPLETDSYFYHPRPESPETVDLIDYCQAPYFHYVGRYLSSLTNFDFNDCFKNGSSMREAFVMKDGSRINKGIMLETNVPPAMVFEDIDLNTAIFLFVVGAGSSISASNVAAATGISAGAGIAGALAAGYSTLNLVGDKGHQSSMAAFNPFGEYETLTFTVDNKAEYVDTDVFGAKLDPDNPVKLDIFADMRKVGEFWLTNRMQPTTISVPIHKCTQLVFWLECGESRSGQYVLYDMTLSKTPMPESEWPVINANTGAPTVLKPSNDRNAQAGRVEWYHPDKRTRVDAIDTFFSDLDEVWTMTNSVLDDGRVDYEMQETFVQTRAGKVYKAVSLVRNGQRYGFSEIMARNRQVMDNATSVLMNIATAYIGLPSANLGILNLEGEDILVYPDFVKLANKALTQCKNDMKSLNKAKEKENEDLQKLVKKGLTIDGISSTDKVLLLPLARGDKAPETTAIQMLEYYRMN